MKLTLVNQKMFERSKVGWLSPGSGSTPKPKLEPPSLLEWLAFPESKASVIGRQPRSQTASSPPAPCSSFASCFSSTLVMVNPSLSLNKLYLDANQLTLLYNRSKRAFNQYLI